MTSFLLAKLTICRYLLCWRRQLPHTHQQVSSVCNMRIPAKFLGPCIAQVVKDEVGKEGRFKGSGASFAPLQARACHRRSACQATSCTRRALTCLLWTDCAIINTQTPYFVHTFAPISIVLLVHHYHHHNHHSSSLLFAPNQSIALKWKRTQTRHVLENAVFFVHTCHLLPGFDHIGVPS